MRIKSGIVLSVACAFIFGCATQKPAEAPASAAVTESPKAVVTPPTAQAKERATDGEIIGTPAPNSRFAKLKIGMTMRAVTALIGAPDDMLRHETGKRWIPFYFGNDVQRMQVMYKNEGCLTFTGGNQFGGGSNELIRITTDPTAVCFNE